MRTDSTKPLPKAASIRAALLGWYDGHGRALPWRISPKSRAAGNRPDAYRVWLSEIMLQQTGVSTVAGYYRRFVDQWPDVSALAHAPIGDVLSAWAGLGYYARARNLHACAKIVALEHGGVFPQSEAALHTLPGIGPYTAAAMAAIVHGQAANVVDGNIERVMARLHCVQAPLPGAKKELKALAAHYLRKSRAADWPQALMDLGALVCKPKNPACPVCPLGVFCAAAKAGQAAQYPRRAAKKPRPVRHGGAFVLQKNAAIWLRQRPEKGLLGGMSEPPGTDWTGIRRGSAALLEQAPLQASWHRAGTVRHVFTHFVLELTVFAAMAPEGFALTDGWWAQSAALDKEALPSLMRKVVALAKRPCQEIPASPGGKDEHKGRAIRPDSPAD